MLGRYDAARNDALEALTGTASDWRAYSTAAKAAYGLGDYRASCGYLESAIKLNPKGAGLQRDYERCLDRLREEKEGTFDFRAMFESLSPQNVHLDIANYLSSTAVSDSPHHGHGLFASHPIKAGELVFCEKATWMPNQYNPERASAALYAMMVRQLYDNPSHGQRVLGLYGVYERTGAEGSLVDGVPVVDVFLAEAIRQKNCFSSPMSTLGDTRHPDPGWEGMAKGLWRHASYLNHSCVPNTMRSFVGDVLVSRAARDIAAGDEIFQQYVPVKADRQARRDQLLSGWGFECACGLCRGEAASSDDMHERRKVVLLQVEKIAKKTPPKGIVPDAAVRAMDRLAKQLEELHEASV